MQPELTLRLMDAIAELICDYDLRYDLHATTVSDPARALARAHLFVTLRQLDGVHKGYVVQFLYEADLIGNLVAEERDPLSPVIALNGADLTDMVLPKADLGWSHFTAADLSRAKLSGAYLMGANLSAVDLISADLSGANLCGANLFLADLTGARLDGADLREAQVTTEQLARGTSTPKRACRTSKSTVRRSQKLISLRKRPCHHLTIAPVPRRKFMQYLPEFPGLERNCA